MNQNVKYYTHESVVHIIEMHQAMWENRQSGYFDAENSLTHMCQNIRLSKWGEWRPQVDTKTTALARVQHNLGPVMFSLADIETTILEHASLWKWFGDPEDETPAIVCQRLIGHFRQKKLGTVLGRHNFALHKVSQIESIGYENFLNLIKWTGLDIFTFMHTFFKGALQLKVAPEFGAQYGAAFNKLIEGMTQSDGTS